MGNGQFHKKRIEFFSLPNGDVMYHVENSPARPLEMGDLDLISWITELIQERYPEAFTRLQEIYERRKKNPLFFRFSIVRRFIRCNFGELDTGYYDIERTGSFRLEEVKCPLRGECPDEGIVCKPRASARLSSREMEVFRLIVAGLNGIEIADILCLAPSTVNNHRENIKKKIRARSISQMIRFWNANNLK